MSSECTTTKLDTEMVSEPTHQDNKESSHEEPTEAEPSRNVVSENETDSCSSYNEFSKSDAVANNTPTSAQEQEDTEEPIQENNFVLHEVRRSIAEGMLELPHKERARIFEEVHGTNHMGMSLGEEMKPHLVTLFLKEFKDTLDRVLCTPLSHTDTSAYELCLQNNYFYATNDSGELRLMCLRAELWNPLKACERFLKHITALYRYYGEDALKQPLDIDFLDYEERNRPKNKPRQSETDQKGSTSGKKGVYKKGKGGSKRKGSLDSLPDMLALKSGSIQVLPSRDRSGRRVVILQPGPSIATATQTQLEVQHSKFKAMFYFLYALIRRDEDAQRKGVVLILNSSKTDYKIDEKEYNQDLIDQYNDFCQSIPLRFSAFHFAYDKKSTESVAHKTCIAILDSYIESDPSRNVARIQLYDEDASNDSTKNLLAPFGIPTHQIPVTHTGTVKLKEHNMWVKIQEWSDKKYKSIPFHLYSKFNVIECPGTNDILFSQGGKYWNGVNRFQRGNLEFMEFLESKIDIYQSTLSWKKKHAILAEAVAEFAHSPQSTGGRPRFLETATQIEGVAAPDGCWVELPLTSPLLMQKIRQTLLNHIRRLESSGKRKPAPTKATRAKVGSKKSKKQKKNEDEKEKQSSNDETDIQSPSKKRKMATSSSSLPSRSPPFAKKSYKPAMSTFGNSMVPQNRMSNIIDSLAQKQSICEFLANAESIAVSTAAVDIACENYNELGNTDLHDAIKNDEKLVQAIIANDDRLNKEVGELFDIDSFLRAEDTDHEIDHDGIADCLMGCLM